MTATDTETIARLARDVRRLKACCAVLGAALGVLVLSAASAPLEGRHAELTTERLNIVAPDGTLRLAIANEERFPQPVIGGKPARRAVNPAGLVFFDDKGDEVGGLALSEPGGGRLSALAFDYAKSDAVALLTHVAADGSDSTAGLVVNSRPPDAMSAASAARFAQRRIAVQNHNESAEVVLSDPAGRARLRLSVDPQGAPRMEMLDEAGKVIYHAP
jgi:hypothetical protein